MSQGEGAGSIGMFNAEFGNETVGRDNREVELKTYSSRYNSKIKIA